MIQVILHSMIVILSHYRTFILDSQNTMPDYGQQQL
jgi:hypothetical protein